MNVELLKNRLKELTQSKAATPRYFTEYNSGQVESLLKAFLEQNSIGGNWSNKRNGWIIECPGGSCHEHAERRDDCTLYFAKKSNGFLYLTARCRHNSCGSALVEHCRELNGSWGKYLNENYVK